MSKKDSIERRINEAVNECQDNKRWCKKGKTEERKKEHYCFLDVFISFPVDCVFQGEIVYIKKKTSTGIKYFPYHTCLNR